MAAKIVWITGASSGIGAETALQMAAKGWRVAASARSVDKLNELAARAEAFTGTIKAFPLDVTDETACAKTVETIENDLGPIDLALFNAGASLPDTLEDLNPQDFKKQFDINVFGVVNGLVPVLQKFMARNAGHIAITASVAGFRGLPGSMGYCSSKAALINMAETLYLLCDPYGIKVQVINPSFVRTPMTDKNDFHMPMRMEPEAAAKALIKGLESNRFEITFPRAFSVAMKLIGALPDRLYFAIMKAVAARL
ncbi:MAG: SDR family NAD(P)-dependent oxidoreductase [Bdellovibrionales bacterium]